MPRLEVRPPRSHAEALSFGWVVFHSLFPTAQPTLDQVAAFVERTGAARMRLALRGGETLAGLVLLPMGQFFGGRSVPMTGVSAVAVGPEHRGGGVGRALMAAALREMSSDRVALSGLYPATQPVYRRLGWEIAGLRQLWRLPTRGLASRERGPAARRMIAEDRAAVHSCYHEWARRRPGMIDRIDWGWARVLQSPDSEVRTYVVDGARGRGIEGYVVTTRQPGAGMRSEMHVRDLVALTPRALRRLLALLGDHRSIAPVTLAWLSPADAAFLVPDESERELVTDWRWMLRIVDVERAMLERGFPAGLSCELVVAIEDSDVRRNAGTWTVGCAAGRGRARRTPRATPSARLHARGLATIYTGHSSAEEAALAGLASGGEDALATLTSMFAGPAPFTPDMW